MPNDGKPLFYVLSDSRFARWLAKRNIKNFALTKSSPVTIKQSVFLSPCSAKP